MSATTLIIAKVLKATQEALFQHSENTGLSIGEVIDRMALDITSNNPKIVSSVLCDEFVLMVKEQTEEQWRETMLQVISNFTTILFSVGMSEDEFVEEVLRRVYEPRE